MSQIQEQNAPQAKLNYDSLVRKQRQLLKEMPSLTISNNIHSEVTDKKTGASSSLRGEKEWISNWQFERIPSTKKPLDFNSDSPITESSKSNALFASTPANNNEGGVFYFERINSINNNTTDLTFVTPTRVSSSDIVDNDQDQDGFGGQDFFHSMNMTIESDDLFSDFAAAADSNDDSEISFDDLMDIVDDDDHDHVYVQQCSSLYEVDEFLNRSTSTANTPLSDDNDMHMTSHDANDNMHIYSSPITNKATLSPSLPNTSLQGYTNSPTCVVHHTTPPSLLTSSFSMSSASTRPAFQQMRKMMTKLMDEGNMPRTRHQDSQLPCAEGMDEMYLDTLQKLSASMARSNRSRKSLSIPLQTMQNNNSCGLEYNRVNQVLQSVQTSSRQVDTCLRSVSMMRR